MEKNVYHDGTQQNGKLPWQMICHLKRLIVCNILGFDDNRTVIDEVVADNVEKHDKSDVSWLWPLANFWAQPVGQNLTLPLWCQYKCLQLLLGPLFL